MSVNFWWCRGKGSVPWLWEQTSSFPPPDSAQVSMAVWAPVLRMLGVSKKEYFYNAPLLHCCVKLLHFSLLHIGSKHWYRFELSSWNFSVNIDSSLYQAALRGKNYSSIYSVLSGRDAKIFQYVLSHTSMLDHINPLKCLVARCLSVAKSPFLLGGCVWSTMTNHRNNLKLVSSSFFIILLRI